MFERSGYHFFTFRNIDVAVSPWYLLLMAFIAFAPMMRGAGAAGGQSIQGIVFAVAVTLSLLVHEFGHAFVSKYYNLRPSVLLHAFGGLCSHQPADTDGKDALILFAGPGAGLVFGGLAVAFHLLVLPGLSLGAAEQLVVPFVQALIFVNIAWSLINLLLPIWPLDGGQLFHLLLRRFKPEAKAQEIALKTSVFVLIPVGIIGIIYSSFKIFIGLLVFFLLMNNINSLKSGRQLVARKAKTRASDFQNELFEEAEEAFERGETDEAYRLCHQLRATGEMPSKMLERVWEILAVSAVEMERFDEAASYIKRAPETPQVEEARQKCEAQAA